MKSLAIGLGVAVLAIAASLAPLALRGEPATLSDAPVALTGTPRFSDGCCQDPYFGVFVGQASLGSGFVVAVPSGGLDPRDEPLHLTGRTQVFTDPNGASWTVSEATYAGGVAWIVPVGPAVRDATTGGVYNFVALYDFAALDAYGPGTVWVGSDLSSAPGATLYEAAGLTLL
ncbi:MAG: hypothetical protein ACT4PT_05725 [Methanobacteriota archaeon]